jgi:hypothetical protein
LQDQNRRHLIDNLPASLNRHVGFAQKPVGLGRCEAFIPQVDWDMQALVQFVGESPHFFRLRAFRAAHPQGKSDNDLGDRIFARQLLELLEIETLVLSLEGRKALRRDPQGVGHCDADSPGAHIQTKHPAHLRAYCIL